MPHYFLHQKVALKIQTLRTQKKHKCPLIAIAIAGKTSSFYSVIYGFSNTNNLTTERKKLEMKLDECGQKIDKSG